MEQSKGFGSSKVTQFSVQSDDVDLFDPVAMEKNIISGRTVSFHPQSGGTEGPYQFHLSPQGADQYLQLNSIRLHGKMKVVKKNGGNVAADKDIGVINLSPHSLFRANEIEINNTLVTDLSSFSSHYQAYMQYILSYSSIAESTHLRAQQFYIDSPNQFDVCKKSNGTDANKNEGYETRAAKVNNSKEIDFYIPICSDILQCDRLLHSSATLSIKLLREVDEFTISTNEDLSLKIDITALKLFAHYVRVSDSLVKKHQTLHNKYNIIYPITRTTMKTFHLTSGESSRYFSNIFMGQIPKSIVIGLVLDDAATGDLKKNPFNFQHFDLKEGFIKVNGEMVPSDPLAPDFANNKYTREFMELHRNVGIDCNEDHGNMVTMEQFAGGSFFMAFDLTGHRCNMLHRHRPVEGNVDLSLTFSTALSNNVRVIVYASSDAQVEISKLNGVTINYF